MIGALVRRVLRLPEVRASYADLVLQQVEAAATSGGLLAAADAGVQQAGGAISRMLSLATVDGPAAAVLTPHVLGAIAFDLVRRGESVWLVSVEPDGQIELLRASVVTVFGGPRRTDWVYSANIAGPTSTTTVRALASEVVHIRVNAPPERPWRGVSPLGHAHATGRLAQRLTGALGDEAGTAVATVIAVSQGTSAATAQAFDHVLSTVSGRRLAFPETQAAGSGASRGSAPQTDWIPRHIQPAPDENAVKLYALVQQQIANLCGLPFALANPDAAGPAQREGFRQLLVGSVLPTAALIQEEVGRVLEVPVVLHHHAAGAADVGTRARAFSLLTDAQVDTERALALVGWG